MEIKLTASEELFLSYLKKELFLKGYTIRNKVSLKELCDERKELNFTFGNDEKLIEEIRIDFMLYKKDKAVVGIEIIDEKEELLNFSGEKMLKEMIFSRLGYRLFSFEDLDKLKESAKEVKNNL